MIEENTLVIQAMVETAQMQLRIDELELIEWRTRKSRMALSQLMEETSSCTGNEFLKTVVSKLASVLNVRYAYVTECVDLSKTKVRILAMWMGKNYGEIIEYAVAEKPCQRVLDGAVCVYPDGLQDLFPNNPILKEWEAQSYIGVPLFHSDGNVIGHLAIVDDKPLDDEASMTEFLKIFAKRAETEIQRRHVEKELKRSKSEIENINRIVGAINAELTIGGVLKAVLEETKMISGVEKATAILMDTDKRVFKLIASTDTDVNDLEKEITLTPEEAELRYVENNQEIFSDIFIVEPIQGRAAEEKFIPLGIPKTLLAMCLKIHAQVEGYFIFENRHEENAFDYKDMIFLDNLKTPILTALIKIRMMEKLKTLNEQKNEFLGFAAHDLRNPLQSIQGYTTMLLEDIYEGQWNHEEAKSSLLHIRAATTRLAHFVSDMMNIASLESNKLLLQKCQDCIMNIFRENEEYYRLMAAKKSIQFKVETLESYVTVTVDRHAILEVFDNLLSNAIKYTHPGGSIRVYFELRPKEIITHVADNGQGLDSNDLQYVFLRYKKLSAKPTGGETSTGLGLAIVKKIIDQHGGRVWVESEKGKGSTFSFALPLQLDNGNPV